MALLVFCDTETTGLDPAEDEIWNLHVQIARTGEYITRGFDLLILHDESKMDKLPENFRKIHDEQYDDNWALTPKDAGNEFLTQVGTFLKEGEKAQFVAANPFFDASFIIKQLTGNEDFFETFDYHLIDIEMLMLATDRFREKQSAHMFKTPVRNAFLPFKSKDLTASLGVDTSDLQTHSAKDDVAWMLRVWVNWFGVNGRF